MSLTGAISSALSGLQLNAARVAASSDNIANVTTPAYKAVEIRATSLVTQPGGTLLAPAGGVQVVVRSTNDVQGRLKGTESPTDLAISGRGFFVVDGGADDGGVRYTRSGSFRPDNQGFLVNDAGYRLLAYPADGRTDGSGAPVGGLVPVNVKTIGGGASATTRITLGANLPASAPIGKTVTVVVQVRDSLGNSLNVTQTFTKTATNTYTLTVANPVNSATGAAAGTTSEGVAGGPPYSVDVVFGSDGLLRGFDFDGDGTVDSATPPALYVSGSPDGAEDLDIALDLGDVGTSDGLTQLGGDFVLGFVDADGAAFGSVTGVTVSRDGIVTARFDNGQTQPVYRVPVAVFTNSNGLSPVQGNAYTATDASGRPLIVVPGSGGAGTVEAGAIEQSNVDLGTEFVRVIQAQIAYGFAVKVLRAADEMAEELVDITS